MLRAFTVDVSTDLVVVRFSEFADQERTPEEEKLLVKLVLLHQLVVFDLTGCRCCGVTWIRMITALTIDANRINHRVAIVGADEELKASADYIGHKNWFHFFDSLDEAKRWANVT